MISEKLQNGVNDQINYEFYSAYIYFSMAQYFQSIDLPGFAQWMVVQTQEELFHANKLAEYINERDGRVLMKTIDQPQLEWASPLDAFEDAYKHEQEVSRRFDDLVAIAREENDNATYNFLQWFVGEQVEEEASVKAVVQDLKMIGGEGHGLFVMNRELGQRVVSIPVNGEGA